MSGTDGSMRCDGMMLRGGEGPLRVGALLLHMLTELKPALWDVIHEPPARDYDQH